MPNRSIHPIKHIRAMPRGSSRPQQILFSDGRHYIVKFKNNARQGTRALVNEYVAGRLARLLHLYPRNLNILNRKQLPGIIVFDQWISNIDRLQRNVLLHSRPRQGGYKVYMIDHGHSFSYESFSHKRHCRWTPYTLKFLPQKIKPNNLYNWFASQARRSDDFFAFVNRIQQLPDEQIYKIIASIPQDWNVSVAEREALFAYLKRTKRLLPTLVTQYLSYNLFMTK